MSALDTTRPEARPRPRDPYALGRRHGGHDGGDEATGHGEGGPSSKRTVVAYGFWIYLLSDIVMFSGFFAAYAVLSGETAGGPTGAQIFGRGRVAIEMPRNSPTGFITAFFSTLIGFALIWHIWWLAALGFVGAYATFVVFAWREEEEYEIPVEEVARIDAARRAARTAWLDARQEVGA